MTLSPLRPIVGKETDQARSARLLRDRADDLLALQSQLDQQARDLRARSQAIEEQQRVLAARIREQGQREGRALDDYVSETIAQGRRALLGDEQNAATELISVNDPRYNASAVADEIIRQGRIRRNEAVDEQPTNQRTNQDADILKDADRVTAMRAGGPGYDPNKVAAMIAAAGRLRRGVEQ